MKRRAEDVSPEESRRPVPEAARPRCPFLDTVDRSALDFDMAPICSVSLSRLNVYGCLVCGRFFQGRGRSTHAYTHSLQAGHFVFVSPVVPSPPRRTHLRRSTSRTPGSTACPTGTRWSTPRWTT